MHYITETRLWPDNKCEKKNPYRMSWGQTFLYLNAKQNSEIFALFLGHNVELIALLFYFG